MPLWFILGAVFILVPIFVFWTLQNINKQKEDTIHLLLEKGAALIRSFEAGTRAGMMGMMGMHGDRFQLQRLLMETAQQPDIVYIAVTNVNGVILAHNDPAYIGQRHGGKLNLMRISRSEYAEWRQVSNPNGADIQDAGVDELRRSVCGIEKSDQDKYGNTGHGRSPLF